VVLEKIIGLVMIFACIAHDTPTFTSCYGTLCICREFSVDQYLFWDFIYPMRWNQASTLNRTGMGFVLPSCF